MASYGIVVYNGSGRLDTPDPRGPTPAPAVSRTQRATKGSNFEAPPTPPPDLYRVVDNWTSLSNIRSTLGPELLSRLPTLDQLEMRPTGRIRPFDCCPLAFCVGQLLTPNKNSPNYCLPIYASIGTQEQAPFYIFAPSKDLTDITSREFSDVEDVDPTTLFQDWDVFTDCVHIQWAFRRPRCWNDLKAQVTYCLLLAWEAERPQTIWQPIPTRIDIADILIDLCRWETKRNDRTAKHDDNGHDDSDDDESESDDDDDDAPPSGGDPVNDQPGTATGRNGSAPDEPYSLPPEATDHLAAHPSARVLGAIKRKQTDSESCPARKRRAQQHETEEAVEEIAREAVEEIVEGVVEESAEGQPLDVGQDDPTQDNLQKRGTESVSNAVKRIQSIKPQYRRQGSRARTPPQPEYEPISPRLPSDSAASMAPTSVLVVTSPLSAVVTSLSGTASPSRVTQTAPNRLQSGSRVGGVVVNGTPTLTGDVSPEAGKFEGEADGSDTGALVAHPDARNAEDVVLAHDTIPESRKRKTMTEDAQGGAASSVDGHDKDKAATTQEMAPSKRMKLDEFLAHKQATETQTESDIQALSMRSSNLASTIVTLSVRVGSMQTQVAHGRVRLNYSRWQNGPNSSRSTEVRNEVEQMQRELDRLREEVEELAQEKSGIDEKLKTMTAD